MNTGRSTKSNQSRLSDAPHKSGIKFFGLSCLGLKGSSGTGRTKRVVGPGITQPSKQIFWRNNLLEESCDIQVARQVRSEVLGMIRVCYEQVKLRRVFNAGFCFGLLDPVSCIQINTLIAAVLPKKSVSQSDASPHPWRILERDTIGDMEERSLRGLVSFLTCIFPCLTDARAIEYLHITKADPLIAAQLIRKDRGLESDNSIVNGAIVERAMMCAAIAGQHPNPQQFMYGWKILSPSLKEIAGIISADATQLPRIIDMLLRRPSESDLADMVFENFDGWVLASSRSNNLKHEFSFPGRDAMRHLLLTMIHGFYLRALAMLPKDELCCGLYYSMLEAGHCYGPLDPVSNIVINTIWYHAIYPPSTQQVPRISMLSTRGLLRIGVRSFYGIVSFMCTRYKKITPDVALRCLQQMYALTSDPDLNDDLTTAEDISSVEEVAYVAAATAAHHPYPDAQKNFLRSSNAIKLNEAAAMLTGDKLTSEGVERLLSIFKNSCSIDRQEQSAAAKLDKWSYAELERNRFNFWQQHDKVVGRVKSALNSYNLKHGVRKYELHVICGVNEQVNGPEDRERAISVAHYVPHYVRENKELYHCSHINFLAISKDLADPPKLFFAECSNYNAEETDFCCVVSELPHYSARCFYCECNGSRIVHPTVESFLGGGDEFVEVLGRGRLFGSECTNDDIITKSSLTSHWVYDLEDDSIYSTATLDEVQVESEISDDMSLRCHLLDQL